MSRLTCQRWACHTQSSMTEACFPCFQGSLSPPAYFNHPIHPLSNQSFRVSPFPVLFPSGAYSRNLSLGAAQQTLLFVSMQCPLLRCFFFKIPQQYKYLPVCLFFHSSFALSWLIVDCFTTFLIGLPGGSMNQAARSV